MLADMNSILTPDGYQTIADLVVANERFEAKSLDPDVNPMISIPIETAAQAMIALTLANGVVLTAKTDQAWLVYTDVNKNITAWKATGSITDSDTMVCVATELAVNFENKAISTSRIDQMMYPMAVVSTAAAAVTPDNGYDFCGFGAFKNALIVNGCIARMKGDPLSTFLASDDTPALGSFPVLTLTLKAPAPERNHLIKDSRKLSVGVAYNASFHSGGDMLFVNGGGLTGTITCEAEAVGATTVTATMTHDGVVYTINEVLTTS